MSERSELSSSPDTLQFDIDSDESWITSVAVESTGHHSTSISPNQYPGSPRHHTNYSSHSSPSPPRSHNQSANNSSQRSSLTVETSRSAAEDEVDAGLTGWRSKSRNGAFFSNLKSRQKPHAKTCCETDVALRPKTISKCRPWSATTENVTLCNCGCRSCVDVYRKTSAARRERPTSGLRGRLHVGRTCGGTRRTLDRTSRCGPQLTVVGTQIDLTSRPPSAAAATPKDGCSSRQFDVMDGDQRRQRNYDDDIVDMTSRLRRHNCCSLTNDSVCDDMSGDLNCRSIYCTRKNAELDEDCAAVDDERRQFRRRSTSYRCPCLGQYSPERHNKVDGTLVAPWYRTPFDINVTSSYDDTSNRMYCSQQQNRHRDSAETATRRDVASNNFGRCRCCCLDDDFGTFDDETSLFHRRFDHPTSAAGAVQRPDDKSVLSSLRKFDQIRRECREETELHMRRMEAKKIGRMMTSTSSSANGKEHSEMIGDESKVDCQRSGTFDGNNGASSARKVNATDDGDARKLSHEKQYRNSDRNPVEPHSDVAFDDHHHQQQQLEQEQQQVGLGNKTPPTPPDANTSQGDRTGNEDNGEEDEISLAPAVITALDRPSALIDVEPTAAYSGSVLTQSNSIVHRLLDTSGTGVIRTSISGAKPLVYRSIGNLERRSTGFLRSVIQDVVETELSIGGESTSPTRRDHDGRIGSVPPLNTSGRLQTAAASHSPSPAAAKAGNEPREVVKGDRSPTADTTKRQNLSDRPSARVTVSAAPIASAHRPTDAGQFSRNDDDLRNARRRPKSESLVVHVGDPKSVSSSDDVVDGSRPTSGAATTTRRFEEDGNEFTTVHGYDVGTSRSQTSLTAHADDKSNGAPMREQQQHRKEKDCGCGSYTSRTARGRNTAFIATFHDDEWRGAAGQERNEYGQRGPRSDGRLGSSDDNRGGGPHDDELYWPTSRFAESCKHAPPGASFHRGHRCCEFDPDFSPADFRCHHHQRDKCVQTEGAVIVVRRSGRQAADDADAAATWRGGDLENESGCQPPTKLIYDRKPARNPNALHSLLAAFDDIRMQTLAVRQQGLQKLAARKLQRQAKRRQQKIGGDEQKITKSHA